MPRGSAPGERRGGRKKGTPNKATAEIKEVARKHGAEAIKALVDLMKNAETEAAKVAACKEILDRGYGKAHQHNTNDTNLTVDPIASLLGKINERVYPKDDA